MDSIHSHANWAAGIGGVSYPLLSDFHPKGEVGRSYGMYIEQAGITARATAIIDAGGTVRFSEIVNSARDMDALAKRCEDIDAAYDGEVADAPVGEGMPGDARLFVKDNCGPSRAALLARDNLHLSGVPVVNVSRDESALDELERVTGKRQAPALICGDKSMLESKEIVAFMRTRAVGW